MPSGLTSRWVTRSAIVTKTVIQKKAAKASAAYRKLNAIRRLTVAEQALLAQSSALTRQQRKQLNGLANRLGLVNLAGPVTVRQRRDRTTLRQPVIGNRREAALEGLAFHERVRAVLGNSQDGKDWAMAALHPCGAEAPMSVGLPDTITAPVVTPNYRGEYEIAWDATMFETVPSAPNAWSVQIVVPPIPEIAFIYRLRDDDTGVWSKWAVRRQPGMQFQSGTWSTQYVGPTLSKFGYSKSRIVGRGTTFELNAAALNNQGRVISGQLGFANRVRDVGAPSLKAPTAASSDWPCTEVEMTVPNSEQYLVSNCPRVYQEEAIKGAYVVQKFDGPLIGYQFKDTGSTQMYESAAVSNVAPETWMVASYMALRVGDDLQDNTASYGVFTDDDSMAGHANSVLPASYLSLQNVHPYVSLPSDMETSVTYFVGMTLGQNLAPTIRVKTRVFLECLSKGSAAVSPFVHPSPMRDMVAIDNVVSIMQHYDDAYPACYNGMGDIMRIIISWLPQGGLRDTLQGVMQSKPVRTIETVADSLKRLVLQAGGRGSGNGGIGGNYTEEPLD